MPQAFDLCRIVGQKASSSHTEVEQHFGSDPVVAHVLRQSKRKIRLDRIQTLLLECVGGDFVGKADAATFLSQVEQNATTLLLQELQAIGQLFSAVATRRPENV